MINLAQVNGGFAGGVLVDFTALENHDRLWCHPPGSNFNQEAEAIEEGGLQLVSNFLPPDVDEALIVGFLNDLRFLHDYLPINRYYSTDGDTLGSVKCDPTTLAIAQAYGNWTNPGVGLYYESLYENVCKTRNNASLTELFGESSNMIDGEYVNVSAQVAAGEPETETFRWDLGEIKTVERLGCSICHPRGSLGSATGDPTSKIYTSTDNTNWTERISMTQTPIAQESIWWPRAYTGSISVRYIKMTMDNPDSVTVSQNIHGLAAWVLKS